MTQTKKIRQFPIIVLDKTFHEELLKHIEIMKTSGTISAEDLSLILFTDSIEEAVQFIREKSVQRYSLVPEKKQVPHRWLFEQES